MKLSTSPLFCLLLGASAMVASMASHAELYYWTSADGSLMATDQQPPAGVAFRTQRDLQTVNTWQQSKNNSNSTKPAIAEVTTTLAATPGNTNDTPPAETDLITVKLSPNAPPQEITPAKIETPNDATTASTTQTTEEKPLAIDDVAIGAVRETESDTKTAELTTENLQADDEAGCQKLYGVNCDKVFNWRKYGEKYCADFKNERCSDAGWFERRFKPLTLEEHHKRTLRNAAARNRDNDEIRHYLQRKYTGICATEPKKAPALCNNAVYDAKILATFNQLSSNDQAEIKRLQQVLKTSKDRNLSDRAIEEFISYLPWAAAASGL